MNRYAILNSDTPIEKITPPARLDEAERAKRRAETERRLAERRAKDDAFDRASEESQAKLTEAFKLLRSMGFIARQRAACCNSCSGYAIGSYVSQKIDEGKLRPDFKGCVFYSKQSGFRMSGRRGSIMIRKLYLQFGPVGTQKHGDQGIDTKECGEIITKVLREVGLAVEWDGNPDTCLLVDPTPGLWEKDEHEHYLR